jgi:hypothetical protein
MGIVSLLICLFGGSRTNADDRLPADPLGRIEGCNGIVEGRDVADVRPQPSVPHPLDDLTQLGTIGLDDEVDCQAVGGPRLGRAGERVLKLLYFQEEIFVYVADGELKTDHSFYLAGQRFLTLHYEIERLAVARA